MTKIYGAATKLGFKSRFALGWFFYIIVVSAAKGEIHTISGKDSKKQNSASHKEAINHVRFYDKSAKASHKI